MNDHDDFRLQMLALHLDNQVQQMQQMQQVFVQTMDQDHLRRTIEIIMGTAAPKPERRKQDWSPRES